MNNDCEMIRLNLCMGCVGLAEKNWVGKQQCEYYKEILKKYKNGKNYDYNQITLIM